MANIPLKSIKFPDLADTYTVPTNAGELPYDKNATYPDDTVGKALQNIGDSSAPAIIETAQGSIASFTDGANVPVKDLLVEIVPVQSGSSDPSPDNVRAISGWTEANISVTGVNVWDEEWEVGAINITDGSNTSLNTTIRSKNYVPCRPDVSYYRKSPVNLIPCYYDKSKAYLGHGSWGASEFTTPQNCYYMRFYAYDYGTTYNNDISINYPSTDHDYHAYNGEVHTISFASAGTVYGGRLDVTSGVLTVDRMGVDMGASDWSFYGTCMYKTIDDKKAPVLDVAELMCEKYKPIAPQGTMSYTAQDKVIFSYSSNTTRICVYDSNYTNPATFKTAVTGTKLVYPLATPVTYQLTPTEVKTLLKNNNIWSDTGDVTVEYVADTKTFIENLVNA